MRGVEYTYEIKQVKTRLTYKEYEMLEKYKEENGCKSIGEALKKMILNNIKVA